MKNSKKWSGVLFLSCAFVGTLVALTGCNTKQQPVQKVSFLSTVQELMGAVGLPACSTLKECVDVTQKEWLRKPGQERWQIENTQEDKRAVVMPYMQTLGCVEEHLPSKKHYTYAFLLGATLPSLRHRLSYLQSCWDRGVRFDQIVCLVGDRSLDKEKEVKVLQEEGVAPDAMPATEIDMMRYLLETTKFSGGMENVPLVVVVSYRKIMPDGSYQRPTSADTIANWLKSSPKVGSILAMSNQPYCVYQQVVIKSLVPREFSVETVGSKAADSVTTAVYLDTIARILYQAYSLGYTEIEPLLSE